MFCPISIYFHGLYENVNPTIFQREAQLAGKSAHKSIDKDTYSTRKNILTGVEVFNSEYNIIGKMDIFDIDTGILTERKNQIKTIYDGYVFQLYAQYFCLTEMGFDVRKLRLYSLKDNKIHNIPLPDDDHNMRHKFEKLLNDMRAFNMDTFRQTNPDKCRNCIYEPMCDRSI